MIMAGTIKLKSSLDGFDFSALHGEAQGPRRGGIVIIQEIFGLDRYVQDDVARWAAMDFEAVAPSMFDRQKPGFVADHDAAGLEEGRKYAMANGAANPVSDVQACVDYLKARGPVFLVGYCYGGSVAWRSAAEVSGLAAASCYYGGRIKDIVDLKLKCPVICHFGRKDAHIPADEFKAAIEKVHPDVPVYIYENSGHGFNNAGRPDADPADAQLARERTLALFRANGAK
jgi:carboxymethylenebutenolidase